MSDGSEHAVRGWKASEMAEQSLVSNRRREPVLHRVWWLNHTNLPISNIVTVMLVGILLGVIMVRRWNARHRILVEKKKTKKKENKKMDTLVETNGGTEEGCCSCSSRDEGETAMVDLKNAHGDVISKRVEEATVTLSSIHSRLPDSMSRKDKVAMTHMMLEAIKVNEACKTTASMERMESISERGVEIQSGTYDMKQRQYRKKEVTKRAQYISKMVMDIMFTGVLVMILSGGCSAWYHGILASKTHTCVTSDTSSVFYGRMVTDMIRTVSCYVLHLVRALQAVIILVLTPVCINKMGIYQKVEDLPIFTLGATFSGICGLSGTYVVRWLGGRGMLWLIMWQMWVIACVLCLLFSSRISKYYLFSTGTSQVKPFRQSGILVAMWIVLGVLYPILMGTVLLL